MVRYFVVAHDGDIRRDVQPIIVEKFVGMLEEEYQKLSDGKVKVPFTIEQVGFCWRNFKKIMGFDNVL